MAQPYCIVARRSPTRAALIPEFFAYLDDLDLALRVQLIGYNGIYTPHAVGYHIGSATLGEPLHPRVVELLTRNQLWLLSKDYPQPVLRGLLPRVLAYQTFWMLFAIRNAGIAAYFRGVRAGLSGRSDMRQKRRELMARRRISDADFIEHLRASEQQIWEWQQSRPQEGRSQLLKIYFRLFGKP